MSNINIVYATKTKHSKKLAEALGQALNVHPENAAEQPTQRPADLLFLVGGIYGGVSLKELEAYAKALDSKQVKSAALITSCVSGSASQKGIRKILEDKGIAIVGEVIVPGGLLLIKAGHPNKKDIQKVVDFALAQSHDGEK